MATYTVDLNALTPEQLQVLQQFQPDQLSRLSTREPDPPKTAGALLVDSIPGIVILAAIVAVFFFRFAKRRETEMTVRIAIEKGQTLGPEVMEKLFPPPFRLSFPSMTNFLYVIGIIAISLGVGLYGVSLIIDDQLIVLWRAWSVAIGSVGIGFVVSGRVIRKTAISP